MRGMRLIAAIAALCTACTDPCAEEIDVAHSADRRVVYSVFTDTYSLQNGTPSAMTSGRVIATGQVLRAVISVTGCSLGFGATTEHFEHGPQRSMFWNKEGTRVIDFLARAICIMDEEARKHGIAPRIDRQRAPRTQAF